MAPKRSVICLLSSDDESGGEEGDREAQPTLRASQRSAGSASCSQGSNSQRSQLRLESTNKSPGPGRAMGRTTRQVSRGLKRSQRAQEGAKGRAGLHLVKSKAQTSAPSGKASGFGSLSALFAKQSQGSQGSQDHRAAEIKPIPSVPSTSGSLAALPPGSGGLWGELYRPRASTDLVVHKKKVEELRGWMETAKRNSGRPGAGCLLLTGPSGSGKTVTVEVLAAEQGLKVTEWTPPNGVSWAEHVYNRDGVSGWNAPSYRSKLDEFEDFVGRSALFPALALQRTSTPAVPSCSQASGALTLDQVTQPGAKLLLVDDLPHASTTDQRSRLANALSRLAKTSRFPTVVITTAGDRASTGSQFSSAALGHSHGLHKELLMELENSGVYVLTLNPITVRNAAKALKGIGGSLGIELLEASAAAIAESASGNLHSAIESLQLHLTGNAKLGIATQNKKTEAKGKKRKKATAGSQVSIDKLTGGMDSGLSLFHTLGKLLHNKRGDPNGTAAPAGPSSEGPKWAELMTERDLPRAEPSSPLGVAERYQRKSSQVHVEDTLARSQMDADTVMGFLQENILDFVNDQRIEDAASCAEYLSCAHQLHDQGAGTSAAASVAARGTIWSNQAPVSRFQPLRAPALWAVEKAIGHNQEQFSSVTHAVKHGHLVCTGCATHLASEVLPYLRGLRGSPDYARVACQALPSSWMYIRDGKAVLQHDTDRARMSNPAGGDGRSAGLDVHGEAEPPDEEIEDC